jgi:2-methylisocitrate lyase-like PEP mutase family enzyme
VNEDRVPNPVELATRLRELHRPGDPLILPNAWDAASARLVVQAGFAAVASTSWGVAESLGYGDGEHAPVTEMIAAAARIAGAVDVPVTVDAEAGYGLEPEELVQRVVGAGAHGCNVEDSDHRAGGLTDAGTQAARIGALRAAADGSGVPLVLNARIDLFHDTRDDDVQLTRVPEAIDRARRYLDAGADCVYPILAGKPAAEAFCAGLDAGNVNLMLFAADPQVAERIRWAAALGVARISFGSSLWRVQQQAIGAALERIAGRDAPTPEP